MDELTEQEHIALYRSRLWTPELDKLLRRWKKQIGKREKGHASLERKYRKRHYMFGVPATIISSISGTGIFATFRNCVESTTQYCEQDQVVRLLVGCITVVNMALVGFQTFRNYQGDAEQHKSSSDDYGALYRMIDTTLLLPGSHRGDPIEALQTIRSQYDELVKKAPLLPKEFDVDLAYNVIDPSKLPTPPGPDQINLRVDNVLPRQTLDGLRKIISDESPNETISEAEVERVLAQENDHDTSEEDREVCLGYDLDAATCYGTGSYGSSTDIKTLSHSFDSDDSSRKTSHSRKKRKKKSMRDEKYKHSHSPRFNSRESQ